ncbi:hypothetical protein ES703_66306 [subsurface metagenome]
MVASSTSSESTQVVSTTCTLAHAYQSTVLNGIQSSSQILGEIGSPISSPSGSSQQTIGLAIVPSIQPGVYPGSSSKGVVKQPASKINNADININNIGKMVLVLNFI